jgi:ATP-dependent DNA helicase RecG
MTKQELNNIIHAGEGLTTEFKTCSEKLPKSLFESICAFLNTKGGMVFLGVNDNGEVLGIEKSLLTRFKKEIANNSNNPQKLSPTIYLKVDEVETGDKTILIIEVPESAQVHKTHDIIYLRNQDGDYKVTHPVEIAKIVNRKQNYHSEQRIFPNVSQSDLRTDLIEKAQKLIRLNNPGNHLWELDHQTFLTRIGFFRKNEENQEGFTLAAVLFFGTDDLIQSLLPAYKIDALLRKENVDRFDDRLIVTTNLLDAYDLLMSFLEKHLNDPFYLEGTTRISLRSKIFRELVANMIAHREYMSPQPAFIQIFKEKIEFTNPNNPSVFGRIDPEHFTPVAKNPTINKLMIQLGRAEDIGSGIRNVTKYLPYYAKDAKVEFIDGELFSTIIQFKEAESMYEPSEKSSQKILQLIEKNNEITIHEISEAIGVSVRTVNRLIRKMQNKNILVREGPKKTGKWRIIGKASDDNTLDTTK